MHAIVGTLLIAVAGFLCGVDGRYGLALFLEIIAIASLLLI